MIFADEMNIKAVTPVFKLLGAADNIRHLLRPGQHHGYVDVNTYFDWFDHAFGRITECVISFEACACNLERWPNM